MEDEGRIAESKQHAGHGGVFLGGFCSKDLWDLQRCGRLVSYPHGARMEIGMLDAVAMVVRREKTVGEL